MKSLIDKIMDLSLELSKMDKFIIREIKNSNGTEYILFCTGPNDYILIYGGHIVESGPRSKIIEYLIR